MARSGALHDRRAAFFAAVGLAVAGLGLVAYQLDAFRRLESATVDTRFSLRGERAPPDSVVVVGIDGTTFNELNLRWSQFSRAMHARVIDHLRRAGARAIAMDLQFTERTTAPAGCGKLCRPIQDLFDRQDSALVQAVSDARRSSPVVLATAEPNADGSSNVFGGDETLHLYGGRAGNASQLTDTDGAIRRFAYELEGLKTFSVVAVERALGRTLAPSAFPDGGAWIDFPGPPGAISYIPYARVLRDDFDRSLVEGRVAVVGAASPTLGDTHTTSTTGENEVMAGPEVQAAEIDTILRGFPLRDAPVWADVLPIVALALIPALLAHVGAVGWALLASVVLGLVYAVGAYAAFTQGVVVSVVYPLATLAFGTLLAVGSASVLAVYERQRTRDAFARFVPEQVVGQVLGRGRAARLRLGGMRVTGTCMFTDVRDSSMFAESRSPETVVDVMNRYLGELTEAILDHGGTLVSYNGDGFMAIFGAPLEQPDHADRALAAAREILQQRLPGFNEWFSAAGFGTGFAMGIGINTGPFIAGNVGSEKRLEYTAMGDTINTAARLESATKDADYYLFLAESTREALTEPADDLVFVSELDIRGRVGTVRVWSLAAAERQQPVRRAG
jgi:adenylate cyclase